MDKKKIGQNIRAVRRIMQLTQAEFAAQLGLSQQQISNYECGITVPPSRVMEDIAAKYDLSMDWLYGLERPESYDF